jgi:uncharacterized repeat protein (TIGR03803 family)
MTGPTISLPALRSAAHFSILMLAVFFLGSTALQAQTEHILHSFTGSRGDGSGPQGLVLVDQAGNVYGSTPYGANRGGICAALGGCGMVFRAVNRNGAFVYNPLYLFHGNDGAQPYAGVVVGPNGVVYGTTLSGGGTGCGGNGCGVVFKLTPASMFCRMAFCSWDETVIYNPSGSGPSGFFSTVMVDNAGNLYGESFSGGSFGSGTVYKLSPSGGGNYTETTLYSFTGGADGGKPMSEVAIDAAGNIYGTAAFGGADGNGTVFKLVRSAGGYTFQLLYSFTGGADGAVPQGNVVLDRAGNLYGASGEGGGIFQITPSGTYTLIDTQAQSLQAPISIDAAGNLYGTTYGGGERGDGSMFKDTYSGGGWTHNVILSFDGANGGLPLSDVGFDASGNMYVTSTAGGQGGQGQGTLVQVTP